jgi:hypothetical protein
MQAGSESENPRFPSEEKAVKSGCPGKNRPGQGPDAATPVRDEKQNQDD